MSQPLSCVLLDIKGPFSTELFRTAADAICNVKKHSREWIMDLALPTRNEASEQYVWNAISGHLGSSSGSAMLHFLVHKYAPGRILAAIAGHPTIFTDGDLRRLIDSAFSEYARRLGREVLSDALTASPQLGIELSLPPADWSWHGIATISGKLLRLLSASHICLYLFTGYPQTVIDVVEQAQDVEAPDFLLPLVLSMSDDLLVKDVYDSVCRLIEAGEVKPQGTKTTSLAALVGHRSSANWQSIRIHETRIAIRGRERVAKWAMKISLPPSNEGVPPRLETIVPIDTAAALLRHVYDAFDSQPSTRLSSITIPRSS